MIDQCNRAGSWHPQEGAVTVPVTDTYPMADATAAYERFAAGGKLGKVILVND
jgi:NADPH:quinone reductase